jgi:hypothetical protein
MVIMRMLQAPQMVFHLELGGAVQGGRVHLTDYEVASRLSYRLTGSMPDAQLFADAAKGALKTLDGVTAEATRLVDSASARSRIPGFIRFYTQLKAVPTPNSFAANYEQITLQNLDTEFSKELDDFTDYVFYGQAGTFKDLMSSSATFARSARVAKIMSTATITGTTPGSSATHKGLLLRPALLASTGVRTSPIVRGAHIRKYFLCDTFGSPDPAAVAAQQMAVGNLDSFSNREKTDKLTAPQTCQGCHSHINPIGYAFEGYSQLGSLRSQEPLFSNTGAFTKNMPIDTFVSSPSVDAAGPGSIAGAGDLVDYIATSHKAQACYARHLFEFQRFRPVTASDNCALADIENAVGSGTLKSVLVRSVSNEDIFWKKAP